MDITITTTPDISAYVSRMQSARLESELVDGVNRTTLHGERLAKQHITANGSVVTGTLRRSTTAEGASAGGGGVTGRYGTNVPYAKHVEFGRGPVVARGRALAFTPKGGGLIFRKRVGPAAPRPFMRPTVPPVRAVFQREMRAAIRQFLAGGGA